MSLRPRIALEKQTIDHLADLLALLFLLTMWLFVILAYTQATGLLPAHYNAKGIIDGYADKSTVWTLPIIATILFIAMKLLSRIPHRFNYPFNITNDNAGTQYRLAVQLMRWLNVFITATFALIALDMWLASTHHTRIISAWFLPVFILCMLLPIVIYFIKATQKR